MDFITDCLVLKMESYIDEIVLASSLFIIYDKKEHHYIIRGKNYDADPDFDLQPFSFTCKHKEELIDFIEKFVPKYPSAILYVLYNYDNLPYSSNEITYQFLRDNESYDYEILRDDESYDHEIYSYDDKNICSRKKIRKFLRILKNVFNYYN